MQDLNEDTITFFAEVKEVKSRKTVSLDMEHSIKLVTENSDIVLLSKFPADIMFKVTITRSE